MTFDLDTCSKVVSAISNEDFLVMCLYSGVYKEQINLTTDGDIRVKKRKPVCIALTRL